MKVGDEVEPAPKRAMVKTGRPRWHVFVVQPMSEDSVRAWFARRGIEAWFPTEQAWRRVPRARRKRVPYERRLVPGYVFARFDGEPVWSEVRKCRWLRRVVGCDGRPAPVSDDAMAEMARVPWRLEAMRKAAEEARRIVPGDRALIRDGAMAGWVVEVREVHAGIARLVVPILGNRVTQISVERLDKQRGVVR